jgi:hypothetical protein
VLAKWLRTEPPASALYPSFEVIEHDQMVPTSEAIRNHLREILISARYDLAYLSDMAELLGWTAVRADIIARGMPTTKNARRGQFGEGLTVAILEQIFGYVIPVRKLHSMITSDQSLPATDALALKLDRQEEITEVCYVESKLRTFVDTMAAVNGYKQLERDFNSRLPAILDFIAARLHDRNDHLFKSFRSYMQDRRDTTDRDTFRLGLCWDARAWTETVLESLHQNGVDIPRLTVHAIRLNDLRVLTDTLFTELGISEVIDDE